MFHMSLGKFSSSVAAAVIGPIVAAVIFFGNSAVIIGLWPAHFIWTYYCLIKYGFLINLPLKQVKRNIELQHTRMFCSLSVFVKILRRS